MGLYVNGAQVATSSTPGVLVYREGVSLTIGSNLVRNASDARFRGRIDEVSLYGRALSPAEIFGIVDAGPAGKNPLGPYINSRSRLPFAVVGQAYSQTFTSVNGNAPVNYELSPASTLPAGLTLTKAGVLSGVPSIPGVFGFVVHGTDAAGLAYEQSCRLAIFEAVVAPAGLVAWWRGESNAQDSVGTNNGTLGGSAGFGSGKVGQAFALNGIDAFVTIPDAPALRPVSLTIETWVAFDATFVGGQDGVIVVKPVGSQTVSASYKLFFQRGLLQGAIGDATGIGPVTGIGFSPVQGRLYHVAYTFDNNSRQQALYVDGVRVFARSTTKSIAYDAQPLLLGGDSVNGVAVGSFQGRIDEASVYNRALAPFEVGSIFDAGPAGKRLRLT
jgi:hypothetical protein